MSETLRWERYGLPSEGSDQENSGLDLFLVGRFERDEDGRVGERVEEYRIGRRDENR